MSSNRMIPVDTISLSPEQLEELKLLFKNHLSPRRLSCITNISQLLPILYKQNIIDTFHREPLLAIKNQLNISSAQIELLTKDLFVDYVSNENNYALERIHGSTNIDDGQPEHKQFSRLAFEQHKQQIYKKITEEIGKKWKDFGRELGIIEGQLDQLEYEERSISERVYQILKKFDEDCQPYERSAKLHGALIECKRKDLAKKITKIAM